MRTERRRMMAAGDLLPAWYQRLEYIQNTSTAYIDTGVQPNYTFEYELKANAVTGGCVVGTYFNSEGTDYRFFQVNNQFYFDVGNKRLCGIDDQSKWTYPYHVKWGNYYIEELNVGVKITYTTFDEKMENANISSNVYLLGGKGYVPGKVWLFKIWDNGKLIRDFVPCKRRSDNVYGMYDKVEGKFYASASNVAFTGGVKFHTILTAFLEPAMAERRAA